MIRRFTERAIDDFLNENKGKTINIVNITELIFYHIQNTPELMNFKRSYGVDTYLKVIETIRRNPNKGIYGIGYCIKEIFQLENIKDVKGKDMESDSIISSLIQNYTPHKYQKPYPNPNPFHFRTHTIEVLDDFTIRIIN